MKMTIKTLVTTVTVASSVGVAVAADYTMRLTHQLPGAHHVAKAIEAFAEEIEINSDGRIEVEVFGGAQLFGPSQFHPAVARGNIEAASLINLQWGGTIPEMQVFNIPGLITSADQLDEFSQSEAAAFLDDKMEARGVKNVAWLLDANNAVVTSSSQPLVAPEDFQGINIRGLSRVFDRGLIAMGAAPSTMPGSEVYQGLQTGVVDAAITSVGAAYSRRYFEVQEYGSASNLISVYQNIIVNPAWWNSLPEDLQEIVLNAGRNAESRLVPDSDDVDPAGVERLREVGVDVTVLSDQQFQTLVEAMRPAIEEAFLETSPDGEKLIELLEQR